MTTMPATTIEEWLQSDQTASTPDVPPKPHRCKRVIDQWTDGDQAYVNCRADDGTIQTHKLVAMSSLSRRACYKCGNVGHYAEVCSSAERLCYNCKQPGKTISATPLQHILRRSFLLTWYKVTSQTSALCLAPPRLSSATTARALGTFRPTAPPCA